MRFSRSVTDISEAMSITYNNRVYDLRRSGAHVTVLSLGEAFFDLPLLSFDALPFPDLYHYSHSRGLPQLRDKLAQFLAAKYQLPVDPEKEIIVTAGSKAAIHMTLMSIVNPGDEVIVSEPAWVSYRQQIALAHATPVSVPHQYGVDDLERFITSKTRAIIVNTPNNPSGRVYSERELQRLLELGDKYDLWILSDEAYSEFIGATPFHSLGALDPQKRRSVIFNSISKNYGISGWRLGYVVAREELIYQVLKVNQHLITCPSSVCSYYVASYFDHIAAVTAPQITHLVEQRNALAGYLREIGLSAMPGDATFYLFVSTAPSRLTSQEFCQRLLEEWKVSAVPGIGYGDSCDQYIRVSVGTCSPDECKHGFRAIKALIDQSG